jgi:hypothetical protein
VNSTNVFRTEYCSDEAWRKDLKVRLRSYVNSNGLYSRWGYEALDFRCRQLFSLTNGVVGKEILEIGGGEGLFALWAVAEGANRVVVLEPEQDGSTSGAGERFLQHRRALGIPSQYLVLLRETFQDFHSKEYSFHLILSYSSINHLDESAVVILDKSDQAQGVYIDLLKKAYFLLCSGGFFIIGEGGRTNYWHRFIGKNPFAPTIEWEKHQDPDLWLLLLNKSGFQGCELQWHRYYPLRGLGRLLCNKFTAKLIVSQFIITAKKL